MQDAYKQAQQFEYRLKSYLDDDSVMDHKDQDDLIDRCDNLIQLFRKLG